VGITNKIDSGVRINPSIKPPTRGFVFLSGKNSQGLAPGPTKFE